jgi:hypothetical protein
LLTGGGVFGFAYGLVACSVLLAGGGDFSLAWSIAASSPY